MPQTSGARFDTVVTLLALSALAIVVWRRRAKPTVPVTRAPLLTSTERPSRQTWPAEVAGDGPLRLAEAALLYELAVIELEDLSESTKLRALRLLAHVIVQIVGALTVEDLPAVVAGVRQVLVEENEDDAGVLIVWNDFARWSQWHLLNPRLR